VHWSRLGATNAPDMEIMDNLILYTSDDGQTRLNLRVEAETIWLTQLEIAELFQTTKQNVSLHAKNIFREGELGQDSVVKESLTTAADGKNYRTQFYNLDLILAIGYRIWHMPENGLKPFTTETPRHGEKPKRGRRVISIRVAVRIRNRCSGSRLLPGRRDAEGA
jgi:hypothetical protein